MSDQILSVTSSDSNLQVLGISNNPTILTTQDTPTILTVFRGEGSGTTSNNNGTTNGLNLISRNGETSQIIGELKELFVEDLTRQSFRIQNRSITDIVTIWEGLVGEELELLKLHPGSIPDNGDILLANGIRNRISVSSTGISTSYYASEVNL